MDALLVRARALLQGEPLRFITYGALIVVWIVSHVLFYLGAIHAQPPGFDEILAAVSVGIAALNEAIRLFVSPASPAA